ncbi:SR34, partial [Symbiodinium sp. KB8]
MSAEGDHVEAAAPAPGPAPADAPADTPAPADTVQGDNQAPDAVQASAPEPAAAHPSHDGGYGGDGGYGAGAPAPADDTGAPGGAGQSDGLPLFVGGLPNPCVDEDFEALANSFGPTVKVSVRTPMGKAGFAFVEYASDADRAKAEQTLNGYNFAGHTLRAEVSHGRRGPREDRGGRFGGRSGTGGHFVRITGVSEYKDWRDLKDELRKFGMVRYADYKDSDQVIIAEFDEEHGLSSCLSALNGGEQLFGYS